MMDKEFKDKIFDFFYEHCKDFLYMEPQSAREHFNAYFNGFETEWCLGGSWGDYNGNCGAVDSEKEPDMVLLHLFLAENYPHFTFLHYLELMKEVQFEIKQEGDYYGGLTKHGIKLLGFDILYDVLNQNGYLDKPKSHYKSHI